MRGAVVLWVVFPVAVLTSGCRTVDTQAPARMGGAREVPASVARPSGPMAYSEEAHATVQNILSRNVPPDDVTSELIELFAGGEAQLAVEASKALEGRQLTEAHLGRLEAIVKAEDARTRNISPRGTDDFTRVPLERAWEAWADGRLAGKSAGAGVEWLIGQLRGQLGGVLRERAGRRLEKIGDPAVPALARVLQTDKGSAQVSAGGTLAYIGTPQARQALERWALPNLDGISDPRLLRATVFWLGKVKSQAAFDPLDDFLQKHVDDQFGQVAVSALHKINGEKARRTLAKFIATCTLDSEHEYAIATYVAAARELARLGDERGKRALRKAASSRIVQVRRRVANAIYLGLGEEGRPLLVKLAGDADPEVAKQGKWWLNELHIRAEQRKADDARARAH